MANSFDDRSVQRIARTVRTVEKSPLNSPTYRRRSRSRSVAATDVTSAPFQMSLSKGILDEQLITISQGAINVQDTSNGVIKYSVESNSVDITSFLSGQTVYIYAKIAIDWGDGSGFKGFGTLTVKTGTGIANTNFAANSVRQPATDSDNYFYEIGRVIITDNEGEKEYELNQVAIENGELSAFKSNSFTAVQLFQGKTNDSDTDTTYDIYSNSAFAYLPDNTVTIPRSVDSVSITGEKFVVLKVSATPDNLGFFVNFLAVIEYQSSIPSNTLTDSYYTIATLGGSFTQHQEVDFLSDGRIW